MNELQDPYYAMEEASNSDLSILAKYWQSFQLSYDIQAAYKFGTLIDCMLTEPDRLDWFRFTCAGEQYSREDFELAERMKKSFMRDEFCRLILRSSELQRVTVNPRFQITYLGFTFSIAIRMKADFDAQAALGIIADLKSTKAKTEKEFLKMIEAFNYDRQAAVYMDLRGVDRFMLIGVSKIAPYPLFKVAIKRGEDLYNAGREKYEALAYQHHNLFSLLEIPLLNVAA